MKNLILPFVVVALFALGSCGDEAVQPSVKESLPKFTLASFKELSVKNLPFTVVSHSFQDGGYDKWDTAIGYYGAYSPTMYGRSPDTIKVEETDSNYFFKWSEATPGHGSNYSLGINIDTSTNEISNVIYTYEEGKDQYNPNSSSATGFFHINKAPYRIQDKELTIYLSGSLLQNSIVQAYWKNSYYQRSSPTSGSGQASYTTDMLPFSDSASVEIKFTIE